MPLRGLNSAIRRKPLRNWNVFLLSIAKTVSYTHLDVYQRQGIRREPDRGYTLTPAQTATALKNALRYIPTEFHEQLAPEFMEELRTRGRIYGYRFRPEGDLKAKSIDEYRGKCIEGKAFQVMIDNNLCFDIALYPYELVTYGETGQVCQNWMQYRLIKQYREELTQDQTLVDVYKRQN